MRMGFAFVLLFTVAQNSLSQQSGGYPLSGYVREERTNVALESATLEILSSGQRAAPPVVSGLDGEFRFTPLHDGDYYIIVNKKGYQSVTVQASIMAGSSPPVSIYLHKQESSEAATPGDSVSARELSIPDKARESFDRGKKLLYDKSAPAKSIAEFQHGIELFPNYYEAYTQIGVAEYRMGKFSDAEKALRTAIKISAGKYQDALYLLAEMFDDQERFADAEPLARQALALNESCWQCEFGLARALVGLKRSEEGEALAEKARGQRPNGAQIYLVLANAHLQEHKYTAVVEDFDAYLKLEPNSPGSASIRERRDRLESALKRAAKSNAPAKQ